MAFDFTQESSALISTTEYSMPGATTVGVPTSQTDTAQVQAWVNIPAMASGDEFMVQLYEKVLSTGTQRAITAWRLAYPIDHMVLPSFIVHNAWDLTIKKIAGVDRTVEWSIRKVK